MSNKMIKGFDGWLFSHNHESIPEFSESAFKAGAALRQAEIDELQKRIDEALDMLEGKKGKVLFDDILETLKGKEDD